MTVQTAFENENSFFCYCHKDFFFHSESQLQEDMAVGLLLL